MKWQSGKLQQPSNFLWFAFTAFCLVLVPQVLGKHTGCGREFNQVIGKIDYKNTKNNQLCGFTILPKSTNTTHLVKINLFLELLTLYKGDSLVIKEKNDSADVLFSFSGSVDAVQALITSKKQLYVQLNISSAVGTRIFQMDYSSYECVINVQPDLNRFAQPIYAKGFNDEPRECEFLYTKDPLKSASYAFIFEKVTINDDSKSMITFDGMQPQISIGPGPVSELPSDLFSRVDPSDLFSQVNMATIKMTFDVHSPDDELLIRKENLIGQCSFYKEVDSDVEIVSPKIDVIPEGVEGLCRWFFETKKGVLGIKFLSLNFTNKLDIAAITDGSRSESSPFYQITSLSQDEALAKNITTTGSSLMVSFKPMSFMESSMHFSVSKEDSVPVPQPMGKLTKCGQPFNESAGKIDYKGDKNNLLCNFTIFPKSTNASHPVEISLFLELLTLHEGDSLVIKEKNDSTDVLFHFSSSVDVVRAVITSEKQLFVQLNISSVVGTRILQMDYTSFDCILNVAPDLDKFAGPIYANNFTGDNRECRFLYKKDVHKNASYAFIFEKVNISNKSKSVITSDKMSPQIKVGPGPVSELPSDFFNDDDMAAIIMTFDKNFPKDEILIWKENLIDQCSYYKEVTGEEKVHSPKLEDIPVGVEGMCRWLFETKTGVLGVKFLSVNFTNKLDIASVTGGGRSEAPPFYQITSLSQDEALVRQIRTTGRFVMVSFKPMSFNESSMSFSVVSEDQGRYMQGNGSFVGKPSTTHSPDDLIYLLEVEKNQNVLLNFTSSSLKSPTVLKIYDDFSTNSNLIAALTGNIWYPILSTTSKMMIQAEKMEGEFTAEFRGTASGCMHMSPGKSDSYILSGNCNTSCAWIIPPIESKKELQLDLQYIALEKSDKIKIIRLDSAKTVVANIGSYLTHVPTLSLDSTVGAYVEITRGVCEKSNDIVLVAQASYLPGCSKNYSLVPYRDLMLTSPNYPNTYPLYERCEYGLVRASESMHTYISFQDLHLALDHCINIEQMYKNSTKTSFSFTGSNMPDDIYFPGNAVIEFNSGKCNSTKAISNENALLTAQGFVINVTSTDCGSVLTSKTGTFETIANKSRCIWKVSVAQKEPDESVNIITFNVKHKNDSGNYNLTVYDGESIRSNKLGNKTSGLEIWSRTNSLIFWYEVLDISKPASIISFEYKTMSCNKSMQCKNGICLHPDWRCNGENECGDFSDEESCAAVPAPPPKPEKSGGVSGVVFGICIIVFFLFGVLIAIVLPKFVDRFRNSRYSQFRDVSVVE